MKHDDFSIVSINIRSLTGKMNELGNFLHNPYDSVKIDCLTIQEIWNVPNGVQYNINGYHPLLYKIRNNNGLNSKAGGGVGLFINEKWEYEILDSISIFKPHIFESIFAKIYMGENKYIIIGSIYRPNTGALASIPDSIDCLNEIFGKIKGDINLNKASDIILTGDFNVNLLDYTTNSQIGKFLDNLLANNQLPLTTHPTRLANRTATLLDFISTNNIEREYSTGIITTALSDHFPVFLTFKISQTRAKKTKKLVREFSENNINNFDTKLGQIDREYLFRMKNAFLHK